MTGIRRTGKRALRAASAVMKSTYCTCFVL